MGCRAIFVAQSFPPVAGSHTTRTVAISRCLAKECNAIGISLAVGRRHPVRDHTVESPIPVLRTFPGFGHSLTHGVTHSQHPTSAPRFSGRKGKAEGGRRLVERLRLCVQHFVVIDSYADAIPHVAWRLRRILRVTDMVVSSSMPNSMHVAVLLSLVGRSNFWLADFADPWTLDASRITRGPRCALENWLERRVLTRADQITFATVATLESYSQVYPAIAGKMRLLRMGFDASDSAIAAHEFNRRTVFYGGSLPSENRYAGALLAVCDALPRLDFVFAGACVPVIVEFFGDALPRNVRCIDWLRHGDLISYIKGADFSVLFGNNNPQQVPGKTYQYAAFAQRVLHIAPVAGSETESLLPPGSRTVPNVSSDILSALQQPWETMPVSDRTGFSWNSVLEPLESAVRSFVK